MTASMTRFPPYGQRQRQRMPRRSLTVSGQTYANSVRSLWTKSCQLSVLHRQNNVLSTHTDLASEILHHGASSLYCKNDEHFSLSGLFPVFLETCNCFSVAEEGRP